MRSRSVRLETFRQLNTDAQGGFAFRGVSADIRSAYLLSFIQQPTFMHGEATAEKIASEKQTDIGTIHLMLTDVVMPGITGRQLAGEAVRLRSDMKVLLMSGYADNVSKSGFLHLGLHFIEKPLTSNALALKIREVLDSSES